MHKASPKTRCKAGESRKKGEVVDKGEEMNRMSRARKEERTMRSDIYLFVTSDTFHITNFSFDPLWTWKNSAALINNSNNRLQLRAFGNLKLSWKFWLERLKVFPSFTHVRRVMNALSSRVFPREHLCMCVPNMGVPQSHHVTRVLYFSGLHPLEKCDAMISKPTNTDSLTPPSFGSIWDDKLAAAFPPTFFSENPLHPFASRCSFC